MATGLFNPGTARFGPPSGKRREAFKKRLAYLRESNMVWTASLDAVMMEFIAEGYSFAETAKAMNLSPAQVSSRFTRLRKELGE
jgi:hypothetical protein